MSNFLELLSGPIDSIYKKNTKNYQIETEYNGKVHGSQRYRDPGPEK